MKEYREMLGRRPQGCISDLKAELYLCGDFDPAARAGIEAHLNACEGCRSMLAAMEKAAAGYAPDIAAIQRTLTPKYSVADFLGRLLRPAVLVPAAAAAFLIVAAFPVYLHMREYPPAVMEKGGASLQIHVRTGTGSRPLRPGDALRGGDTIKFAVNPGEHRFVTILDAQQDGKVTVYYPAAGRAAEIEMSRETVLPGSIRLDDYRGIERIYAVFSDEPLDAAALASRAGEALKNGSVEKMEALPIDMPQASVLIRKE